jgi:hypothetical protein
MNILDQAEKDLSFTIEDKNNGFGVELKFIDKDNEMTVIASVNDTGYFIDPQTGVGVAGRRADVSIRMSTILALSNNDPPDNTWNVEFTDKNNDTWKMSVIDVMPDRTLGLFYITLEAYDDSED